MRRKWLSLLLAAAMLCSLLPAASAAATQLPTPEVEWLTEDETVEGRQYKAGQAVMTNVPTEILPNYSVEIVDAATDTVVESYEDGFGSMQRSTQEIWVGWYMDEGVLPSGTYYIRAKYLGDNGQTYTDSAVGTSNEYTYTYPGVTYAAPTNVHWDGANFGYTLSEEALTDDTILFLQFEKTDGDDAGRGGRRADSTSHLQETDNAAFLERFNERLTRYGAGNYKFRIRVISQDITQKWHSDWSEWSEERYVSAEGLTEDGSLADDLDKIIENLGDDGGTVSEETKTAAVEQVQNLDQKALREAMSADQDGTGVTQQMADLEEKLGIGATVTVEDETLGIDANDVEIIGAGFSTEGTGKPDFTISMADEEISLSNTYQNRVQMEFSLAYSLGADTQLITLAVPIQITIPVPEGIDSRYLRIIHYRQDNSRELITPYIFDGDNGTKMARFTVDQLSPFVFAEYRPFTVTFDLNGGEGAAPAARETDEDGRLESLPDDPVRTGHSFTGWFTAKENGQKVTTAYQFTADATVYAVWQAGGGGSSGGGGGGGGSSGPTRYTVSAPSADNGRVALSSNRASKGSTVTLTVTPDEGYELAALTVTDAAGNVLELTDRGDGRYAFTMPAGQVEIHAEFREIAGPEPVQLPYADVAQDAWYYDAVAYAYENGLMEGVGGGSFAPAAVTDRAMLATLLWRLEGEPVVNYLMAFDDVAEGLWYSEAVRWASAEGVVSGVGDGSAFAPGSAITREQMAVMLYRYAQYKGYDVSQGGMAVREFDDYASVSEWARYAMEWAVAAGLISGTSGTTLSPQGQATRAEIAAILMRFAEKYVSAE